MRDSELQERANTYARAVLVAQAGLPDDARRSDATRLYEELARAFVIGYSAGFEDGSTPMTSAGVRVRRGGVR